MRELNQAGLELIKSFESFRAYPYKDEGGVWTIGYGHTRGVNAYSVPLAKWQAEDLLREDVREAQEAVERMIYAQLNDSQYAALVSLVYNTGPAPLAHTLGVLLNRDDYGAAAEEFMKWNHVNGRASAGLTIRRAAEQKLFLTRDQS